MAELPPFHFPRDFGSPGRFVWEQNEKVRLLRVNGEVDLSNASHIMGVLTDIGRRDLVIDLTAVEFMDSTGIGALVELKSQAPGECELRVRRGSQVDRLLHLTGLKDHFEVDFET